MAKNKTTETSESVDTFLKSLADEKKRKDCYELIELIRNQTKLTPKMWGSSIIGFGSHHYRYESGREGDSPDVSFSPRSASIALYLSSNLENRDALLGQLGKHKTDKGCIHIKTLADVDREVLATMIRNHVKEVKRVWGSKDA